MLGNRVTASFTVPFKSYIKMESKASAKGNEEMLLSRIRHKTDFSLYLWYKMSQITGALNEAFALGKKKFGKPETEKLSGEHA